MKKWGGREKFRLTDSKGDVPPNANMVAWLLEVTLGCNRGTNPVAPLTELPAWSVTGKEENPVHD